MTEPTPPHPEFVGSWRKGDAPACAAKYPDSLTFAAGTYRGARGAQQGAVWWDAGIYRIEHLRLLLSVATDELMTYEFQLDGDVLAVVDPDGCRFSYHRDPPTGGTRAQPSTGGNDV